MYNKIILTILAILMQAPTINRAWASNPSQERNLFYKVNVAHVHPPSQLYHYHSMQTHTIESYHLLIGGKSPGSTHKSLEQCPSHLYEKHISKLISSKYYLVEMYHVCYVKYLFKFYAYKDLTINHTFNNNCSTISKLYKYLI